MKIVKLVDDDDDDTRVVSGYGNGVEREGVGKLSFFIFIRSKDDG